MLAPTQATLYKRAGPATQMKIERGASHGPSCRISWRATAFAICLSATAVHARQTEKCDALVPAQGQIEYRWRQNRCEGFYRSNVSSGDLELVSLLLGHLAGDTTRDARLEIVVPAVPRSLSGPIQIRAVAIPPRTYYRMDATANAGGRLSWPLGEVVGPAQLSMERVGVFGWVDASPERVFVPLRVVPSGQAGAAGGPIELRVRSSSAVDWVRWRAHVDGAAPQDLPAWQDAAQGGLDAWKPVTVVLPAGAAAILRVDVRAKPQNSDQTQLLSFRVARPDLP
jgi:hypothetical protein